MSTFHLTAARDKLDQEFLPLQRQIYITRQLRALLRLTVELQIDSKGLTEKRNEHSREYIDHMGLLPPADLVRRQDAILPTGPPSCCDPAVPPGVRTGVDIDRARDSVRASRTGPVTNEW